MTRATTEDDTAVEVPTAGSIPEARAVAGAVEVGNGDNGVVEHVDAEDTPLPVRETLSGIHALPEGSEPPTAHDVAQALVDLMPKGGGGGGDDSGPIDLKKFSKKNWLANTIIALIVAGSGAFAAYKATEARSKDNAEAVQENEQAIEEIDKELGDVKDSVDDIGEKLDEGFKVQVKLVEGIDQLKKEAQTEKQIRLEEKVKQLERENRRLERGRNR